MCLFSIRYYAVFNVNVNKYNYVFAYSYIFFLRRGWSQLYIGKKKFIYY